MRKKRYLLSLIILSYSFLFSQIDISSVGCDNEQRNIHIPILGGNLKPEVQPTWSPFTGHFIERLQESQIQMLRWPGAEASNFFSWHAGTFIPCYKWDSDNCLPYNDSQAYSEYCEDPICETSDGEFYYARDYQTFDPTIDESFLLDECIQSVNTSSNFASQYVRTIREELDNLSPLFVLNVMHPHYYHIDQEFIDSYIDPIDCSLGPNGAYDIGEEFEDLGNGMYDLGESFTDENNNGFWDEGEPFSDEGNGMWDDGEMFYDSWPMLVNSIEAQVDTICHLVEEYGIELEDVHIQLGNEPWHNHQYKLDLWPNGGSDYAQDMINAAEIIRQATTPNGNECGEYVKIGLSGDVHSYNVCNDAECEGDNINPLRCEWNSSMWAEIVAQGKEDLFDAVSFQEYGGIRQMRIPQFNCFDENTGELIEGCNAWEHIDYLDGGSGYYFREFGEQAGGSPPSTADAEYNNIIMDYFNKWLPLQVDRNLNTLNGEPIDWEDEENEELCGDYEGLYPELLYGFDKEIWITEYEPITMDPGYNLYERPYQGSWSHAILFLYSTLAYITETSNLKVLINNNANGIAGNYRLIDSYSYPDSNEGTNSCRYICNGGECNTGDERDLCINEYPSLSPKGLLMSYLNELAWINNQIETIVFNDGDVQTTEILRYGSSWKYYPKDLYGWKFSDDASYLSGDCLESNNHDYLFMNVSENEYSINFDDCNAYQFKVIQSDNMFAKNYHHDDASTYTTVPYPDYDDDVVFSWEFFESNQYSDDGGFFEATSEISFSNGLINNTQGNSILTIPPHSVVQVRYSGTDTSDDCLNDDQVADVDGNIYSTIQIGDQVWMAENLRATRFNNGEEIPTFHDDEEWGYLTSPGYSEEESEIYGNLYNWFAVDDNRGICPEGWHVPSNSEYQDLEIFLGVEVFNEDSVGWVGDNQGSQLAGNDVLWEDGLLEYDLEFGLSDFNILPAGRRLSYSGEFSELNERAYLWTSTETQSCSSNYCDAWVRIIDYTSTQIGRFDYYDKAYGQSVRCIQDNENELNNNDNVPSDYSLYSAYPNPFNPITTITYQVPEYTKVSIKIYNLNGQLVENLYEGLKTPGSYTINWNASNFSSGIYIIKMISGHFVQTQKIVLAK